MAYLGIFEMEFKNNTLIFEICLIKKFLEEMNFPKFGTKNALFWYFWFRTLKNYCHISNQYT